MTRPIVYVFVILVLSLFEGYCKKYLVETEDDDVNPDNVDEFGEDYSPGAVLAPKPYGSEPNSQASLSCTWDAWGKWSRSVTCGSGTKTRHRVCKCADGSQDDGEKCGGGKSSLSMAIDEGPCFTCSMGSWTSFSSSTATCGKRTSVRTRSCTCTDGTKRPDECGEAVKEFKEYDEGPCPYNTPKWTPKPYRKRRHRRS